MAVDCRYSGCTNNNNVRSHAMKMWSAFDSFYGGNEFGQFRRSGNEKYIQWTIFGSNAIEIDDFVLKWSYLDNNWLNFGISKKKISFIQELEKHSYCVMMIIIGIKMVVSNFNCFLFDV